MQRSAEVASKTNEGEAKRSEVETAKRFYLDPPVQFENTARAVSLSRLPESEMSESEWHSSVRSIHTLCLETM